VSGTIFDPAGQRSVRLTQTRFIGPAFTVTNVPEVIYDTRLDKGGDESTGRIDVGGLDLQWVVNSDQPFPIDGLRPLAITVELLLTVDCRQSQSTRDRREGLSGERARRDPDAQMTDQCEAKADGYNQQRVGRTDDGSQPGHAEIHRQEDRVIAESRRRSMVRPIFPLSLCLLVLSACAPSSPANKAEPSVAPVANDRYATEQGRAVTLQILEGDDREKYQKPDKLIENLKLTEGDVVIRTPTYPMGSAM
jgi:hypothetical protein